MGRKGVLIWHGIIWGLCSQIHLAVYTIINLAHTEKFPTVYLLSQLSDPIFKMVRFDKTAQYILDKRPLWVRVISISVGP